MFRGPRRRTIREVRILHNVFWSTLLSGGIFGGSNHWGFQGQGGKGGRFTTEFWLICCLRKKIGEDWEKQPWILFGQDFRIDLLPLLENLLLEGLKFVGGYFCYVFVGDGYAVLSPLCWAFVVRHFHIWQRIYICTAAGYMRSNIQLCSLHWLITFLRTFIGYSPESPREMSPDAVSPYPERPIRPLPKRRLRERLSPDVAESITYPPAPKTTTPLFYHPYNDIREEPAANGVIESQHPSERERADEIERNYITRRIGDDLESDEDEAAYRSRIYSRHSADTTGRSYRYVQKPDPKHPNPQPPASTASSADGYDSFENTNNKKKRKIPTPGDSNLNGVHLSGDVAGNGISGPEDLIEDVGSSAGAYQQTSGMVGQGISGPGRGRYGRIRNGRSPLRTLSDASSNWGNSRTAKQRQPAWPPSSKPQDA